MRRFFTTIIGTMLLFASVAMAMPFNASDKKDDKKEEKKEEKKEDNDKGHEPVVIIYWENAWRPIYR